MVVPTSHRYTPDGPGTTEATLPRDAKRYQKTQKKFEQLVASVDRTQYLQMAFVVNRSVQL
jgi:hypothetical protein